MGRFDSLIGQMGSDNPLRSVADYEGDMLKREQLRMAMGANALTMDERKQKLAEYQRGLGEQAAVRNILAGLGPDAKPEAQIGALRSSGLPTGLKLADELEKNYDTRLRTNAEVAGKNWTVDKEKNQIISSVLSRVAQDPSQWDMALKVLEQNSLVDFKWSSNARKMASQASPEAIQQWAQAQFAGGVQPEKLLPKTTNFNSGGFETFTSQDPLTGRVNPAVQSFERTQSPDNAATNARAAADAAASRSLQERRLNFDIDNKTKEDADPGKYTQVVIDPDKGLLLADKKTGKVTPMTLADGSKVPGKNVTAAQKLDGQLKIGIEKARELIPLATGSGFGRAVDATTGFVGISTAGDDASTSLETLAGWMTSNVPRMQGPQSDKDTLLYRQMAAQVGDRTKTRSARLKALDTLEELRTKYAEKAGTDSPPPSGAPTRPPLESFQGKN